MSVWTVELAPEFVPELQALSAELRMELLAQARVNEMFGPAAKRPRVDTLNGSKPMTACGGWRSRSIRNDRRSCWWPETKVGRAKQHSIGV